MSRTTRRLTIGLSTAILATGLATAPAMAQDEPPAEDLPATGSAFTPAEGWSPGASVEGWAALGSDALWAAQYNPIGAISTAVLASTAMPLSGGTPLFPWCGPFANVDSPVPGCEYLNE
ncbi:MAG: hypothetical protein ACTH1D_09955 [Mycobacteriaceae bacterium]|uniref:hypothetical protein n=1 Tax=Corynebacterium sp. TaxID=1720 RepID=UPI003F9BDD36